MNFRYVPDFLQRHLFLFFRLFSNNLSDKQLFFFYIYVYVYKYVYICMFMYIYIHLYMNVSVIT